MDRIHFAALPKEKPLQRKKLRSMLRSMTVGVVMLLATTVVIPAAASARPGGAAVTSTAQPVPKQHNCNRASSAASDAASRGEAITTAVASMTKSGKTSREVSAQLAQDFCLQELATSEAPAMSTMSISNDADITSVKVFWDAFQNVYYATMSFSWLNSNYADDESTIFCLASDSVGGFDGFGVRLQPQSNSLWKFGFMGAWAKVWGNPALNSRPDDYGTVNINSPDNQDKGYGVSYLWQDNVKYTQYESGSGCSFDKDYDIFGGSIVYTFVAAPEQPCRNIQAHAGYFHTYSSTTINSIGVQKDGFNVAWSSLEHRWDTADNTTGFVRVCPGGPNGTDGSGTNPDDYPNPGLWPGESQQELKRNRHDFDGDNDSDVIWVDKNNGNPYLLRGNGHGGWDGQTPPGWLGAEWDRMLHVFSPGDFDGDGNADVIWVDKNDGNPYLLRGNGEGGWLGQTAAGQLGAGWDVMSHVFSPGDFDGDGDADVIWVDKNNGNPYLLRGNGHGGWDGQTAAGQLGAGWDVMLHVF